MKEKLKEVAGNNIKAKVVLDSTIEVYNATLTEMKELKEEVEKLNDQFTQGREVEDKIYFKKLSLGSLKQAVDTDTQESYNRAEKSRKEFFKREKDLRDFVKDFITERTQFHTKSMIKVKFANNQVHYQ